MEEVKEKEKKNKKKIFIIIGIILLVICAILFWWFNRKFDITIKYNNSTEQEEVKVKYLHKLPKDLLKEDITLEGYTFIGYFETYDLNSKQLEEIKADTKKEESICRKGFKLNSDKNKCISEEPYDINTKIKKEKTIEALWSTITFLIDPTEKTINENDTFNISVTLSGTSDTSVKWSSENTGIATVDDSGKVKGIKEGQTKIVAESNGIRRTCIVTVKSVEKPKEEPKPEPKDEGTVSLSTDKKCIIGNQDVVTISATLNNATDKTINWTLPKCYTSEKNDTVVKLNRTGRGTQCRIEEEPTFTVTAKLNNGSSDSTTVSFEPTLSFTVKNGSTEIQPNSDGAYKGNNITIETNIDADFSAIFNNKDVAKSKTNKSVTIEGPQDATVTIKTGCGQTKTINIVAEIN